MTSWFPVHDGPRAKLKFCVKAKIKTLKLTLKADIGISSQISLHFAQICLHFPPRTKVNHYKTLETENSGKLPGFIWLKSSYFNSESRQAEIQGPSSKSNHLKVMLNFTIREKK